LSYSIFYFHKPFYKGEVNEQNSEIVKINLEIVTNEYLRKLPKYVHEYINEMGGLKKSFFAVTAKDLGVPICDKYL